MPYNKDLVRRVQKLVGLVNSENYSGAKALVLKNTEYGAPYGFLLRACTNKTFKDDLIDFLPNNANIVEFQEKMKKVDSLCKIPLVQESEHVDKPPFIFIRLDSCIGVVSGKKGCHLVQPYSQGTGKKYAALVHALYEKKTNDNLTIYEPEKEVGEQHLDQTSIYLRKCCIYLDGDYYFECLRWFFEETKKDFVTIPEKDEGVILVN